MKNVVSGNKSTIIFGEGCIHWREHGFLATYKLGLQSILCKGIWEMYSIENFNWIEDISVIQSKLRVIRKYKHAGDHQGMMRSDHSFFAKMFFDQLES